MVKSEAAFKMVTAGNRSVGFAKIALILLPLLLVSIQWTTDTVLTDQLLTTVPVWTKLSWLESPWTYFYLHIFTVVPVFCLSFNRKVHYYTSWRKLAPAVTIIALIFILWDVVFTARGVWGFNEDYLSGLFFLGLPVEEWLFFFTVPFACVFVYECLNTYIEKDLLAKAEKWITPGLIAFFFIVGFWKFWHMYTATTFILAGGFLLYHYLFLDGTYRSRFYLAFLVISVPFLLVNGVLTGGFTEVPVVQYNPAEYFGVRIGSVPVDDSAYNFLMLFSMLTIFEGLRGKKAHKTN